MAKGNLHPYFPTSWGLIWGQSQHHWTVYLVFCLKLLIDRVLVVYQVTGAAGRRLLNQNFSRCAPHRNDLDHPNLFHLFPSFQSTLC